MHVGAHHQHAGPRQDGKAAQGLGHVASLGGKIPHGHIDAVAREMGRVSPS